MQDPMIVVAKAEEQKERNLDPEIRRLEHDMWAKQRQIQEIGREMVSIQLRLRDLKRKKGICDDRELEARRQMMDDIAGKELAPQILYPEW